MTLATLPTSTEIFRAPSLVFVNPSNLTNEAGYGTLLGDTDGPYVADYFFPTITESNELDSSPVRERLIGRPWWEIRIALVSKNLTALQLAFAGQATAGGNVETPGAGSTFIPGVNLVSSTYCKRILVMPFDECARHPCLLVQFGLGRMIGSIKQGRDETFKLNLLIRTFDYPSSVSPYRRFYFGNKANVTLLS